MRAKESDLEYQRWIARVFDRPVTEPAWWWDDAIFDEAPIEPDPETAVSYLTRLFDDPAPLLATYSADQIGQGLWFLCDNSCSNHLLAVADDRIDWASRRRCIEAIPSLHAKLFARACKPDLSHQQTSGSGRSIETACYMFWDIAPLSAHRDASHREQDETCLNAMRETLRVDHVACQESALHGLGHFHYGHPARVAEIVDAFLRQNPKLPPALHQYATMARVGRVQ